MRKSLGLDETMGFPKHIGATFFLLLPYIWWRLDDSFLGEATAAGFASSLGLKPNETEEVYTDTKIALFAFTWLLMLWRRPDVRLLIPASIALQAILILAHNVTPTARYLLLVRSFLGINGAIFPGALLLLSELCNKHLAMVATAFVAVTPLSIAVAGPILSAIFSLLTDKLHLGWRTMFALDGTLGLLIALGTWWQAPTWTERLSASTPASEASSNFDWDSIFGLLQAKKLMLTVVFGCCNLVIAQAPSYLGVDSHEIFSHAPYYFFTVFSDLGVTRLTFNVLTAAPYLVACCYMIALLRSPSNTFSVGIHMIVSAIGFGIMSLGAYLKWNDWVSYYAIFPACVGSYAAMSSIVFQALGNEHSSLDRGLMVTALLATGQLASLLSPAGVKPWWRAEDEPSHPRGLGACAIIMIGGAAAELSLRCYLRWKVANAKTSSYTLIGGDVESESEAGIKHADA